MTELFARRLADEFGVDFRWLLGEIGTMDSLQLGSDVMVEEETGLWLPVFLHPVEGSRAVCRSGMAVACRSAVRRRPDSAWAQIPTSCGWAGTTARVA